jgi:hypothetical protein
MRELFVSAIVFATILTAMAFGVMLGYTVIVGILRLFGHRRQIARPAPAPVMVVATTSSGD